MIESILTILESSTPALRERYLQRIRHVKGEEARKIEQRLRSLVEQDRARQPA